MRGGPQKLAKIGFKLNSSYRTGSYAKVKKFDSDQLHINVLFMNENQSKKKENLVITELPVF